MSELSERLGGLVGMCTGREATVAVSILEKVSKKHYDSAPFTTVLVEGELLAVASNKDLRVRVTAPDTERELTVSLDQKDRMVCSNLPFMLKDGLLEKTCKPTVERREEGSNQFSFVLKAKKRAQGKLNKVVTFLLKTDHISTSLRFTFLKRDEQQTQRRMQLSLLRSVFLLDPNSIVHVELKPPVQALIEAVLEATNSDQGNSGIGTFFDTETREGHPPQSFPSSSSSSSAGPSVESSFDVQGDTAQGIEHLLWFLQQTSSCDSFHRELKENKDSLTCESSSYVHNTVDDPHQLSSRQALGPLDQPDRSLDSSSGDSNKDLRETFNSPSK